MRLPRPCRLLVCRRGSSERGIGQTATDDVGRSGFKPGLVILVLAVVVAERLLIEVAKQMERFDTHIGSAQAALQQRPEVLKAISDW